MELRGLGVINVKDLFGIASTRLSKRVELVVQLERWEPGREYERLGLDDEFYEILGLKVPLIRMPVAPGRSVAILVEVAARNQLLRSRGHHAARALAERLDADASGIHAPVRRRGRRGSRARRAAVKRKEAEGGRAAGKARKGRRQADRLTLPTGERRRSRASRSSCSRACPDPASRRPFARSKISATSASTTCRRR